MPADQNDLSPEEFLVKMDAEEFDGNIAGAIKKLPNEHLERIANILMDRQAKQRAFRSKSSLPTFRTRPAPEG